MSSREEIGWRALYKGGIAHYWRTHSTTSMAIALCWIVTPVRFLTNHTRGEHCSLCEIMLDRENSKAYIPGRDQET